MILVIDIFSIVLVVDPLDCYGKCQLPVHPAHGGASGVRFAYYDCHLTLGMVFNPERDEESDGLFLRHRTLFDNWMGAHVLFDRIQMVGFSFFFPQGKLV